MINPINKAYAISQYAKIGGVGLKVENPLSKRPEKGVDVTTANEANGIFFENGAVKVTISPEAKYLYAQLQTKGQE
jgi:hypothetical protein